MSLLRWLRKPLFHLGVVLINAKVKVHLQLPEPGGPTGPIDLNDPTLKPRVSVLGSGVLQVQAGLAHFMGVDGSESWFHGDGRKETRLSRLEQVQINDLSLVTGHRINQVHQTTSHVLYFAGGGVLTVLYGENKQICELTTQGLATVTTFDPAVITILHSQAQQGKHEVWVER